MNRLEGVSVNGNVTIVQGKFNSIQYFISDTGGPYTYIYILPGKFPETRDSVQRKQVYKPNIFKYLQGYVCVHFRYQAGPCEGRGQHAVQ